MNVADPLHDVVLGLVDSSAHEHVVPDFSESGADEVLDVKQVRLLLDECHDQFDNRLVSTEPTVALSLSFEKTREGVEHHQGADSVMGCHQRLVQLRKQRSDGEITEGSGESRSCAPIGAAAFPKDLDPLDDVAVGTPSEEFVGISARGIGPEHDARLKEFGRICT
jgi:hypothetical protein